jgi:polyisoprenyl-phosphate glycosyltransferase
MRVGICIPIFNDWNVALLLLARLDDVARSTSDELDVLFVDDGSSEQPPERLETVPEHLFGVSVLRLRRNLGHQRAIAIGLAQLYVDDRHDAILVMDGDGEDDPNDVPKLLERVRSETTRAVFAKRAKRSEGLVFRLGYLGFKIVHRALTGRKVEVGNFSVLPRSALARLVAVSELWNHYAAAVSHARLPVDTIPIPRGTRLAGKSKMNFVSLTVHGLSAISVYSDIIGVRMLATTALIGGLIVAAMAVVAGIRMTTTLAIPGWATSTIGILLLCLLNLGLVGMAIVLVTLQSRTQYTFIPLRDYANFVLDRFTLYRHPE